MPNGDALDQRIKNAQERVLTQKAEGNDDLIAAMGWGFQRNREANVAGQAALCDGLQEIKTSLDTLPERLALKLTVPAAASAPATLLDKAREKAPAVAAGGGVLALILFILDRLGTWLGSSAK